VVFPQSETDQLKHDLPDKDDIPEAVKRRRVLSFSADVVDDSEGEEEDFWLTGIENLDA
jgi:hypothetical protein